MNVPATILHDAWLECVKAQEEGHTPESIEFVRHGDAVMYWINTSRK
jgi:hypothetical protein